MKIGFLLIVFCLVSQAETWSTKSGASVGPSGISISTPATGQLPELTYKDGSFNLNFSLLGKGNAESPPPSGPIRILSPAASTPSNLSDSNDFFRGVGKKEPTAPVSSRPRTR